MSLASYSGCILHGFPARCRLLSLRPWLSKVQGRPAVHAARHWHARHVHAAAATETLRLQASQTQQMSLSLYNSLSKKKEEFRPLAPDGSVSMYVCGVTVYDYSHIGHARVYTSFDILYRYLQHLGFKVNYVRNFTDIDDKIIKRAKELECSPQQLSQRFIDEFHEDMTALNCLPPNLEPRATQHVKDMIEDIERIIENGHGYPSQGDIFFDIASLPGYGRLSGRTQEDNRAGERVAVDERKRNAADFALWKAAKEGEPRWESPWGPGRPGWHIECSAMIRKLMGPIIDIHGGGRDLVFPHHENEMAQAQAAASSCECERMPGGRDFVRFWLHNGFVNVDSEKMSKSLGNFFTIRDVIKQYHPLALRFFLINSQYRQPINYTQRGLEAAADRMYYIFQALCNCQEALAGLAVDATVTEDSQQLLKMLHTGLGDDLNTSVAIGALSEPLKTVNDLIHTKQGKKAAGRIGRLASIQSAVQTVLGVLGLGTDDPVRVLQDMRQLALHRSGLTEKDVTEAIARRAEARKAKDFAAADGVREEMARKGIQIMDTPAGTVWRPNPRLDIANEPVI